MNLLAEESDGANTDGGDQAAAFGPQAVNEGINTDEFEHIAEIYD